MKLKCNVCIDSPTVELPKTPSYVGEVICCPSCDKELACADKPYRHKNLVWIPKDISFNKEIGITPVTIIKY